MHRDIKPSNIFVTRREHLKILGFGLAKLTLQPRSVAEPSAPTASTASTEVPEKQLTSPGSTVGEQSSRKAAATLAVANNATVILWPTLVSAAAGGCTRQQQQNN